MSFLNMYIISVLVSVFFTAYYIFAVRRHGCDITVGDLIQKVFFVFTPVLNVVFSFIIFVGVLSDIADWLTDHKILDKTVIKGKRR